MEFAMVVGFGVACFAAGVVFAKVVLSDLEAVKAHVTSEVQSLRGVISSALAGAAKKI